MSETKKITFMTNWNNKLCCYYFTTIRMVKKGNDTYYKQYHVFDLFVKSKFQFSCEIVEVKKIKGSQITNFLALIDSGMCLEDFIKFCCKIYKINEKQFMENEFLLLLFKRLKTK